MLPRGHCSSDGVYSEPLITESHGTSSLGSNPLVLLLSLSFAPPLPWRKQGSLPGFSCSSQRFALGPIVPKCPFSDVPPSSSLLPEPGQRGWRVTGLLRSNSPEDLRVPRQNGSDSGLPHQCHFSVSLPCPHPPYKGNRAVGLPSGSL